MTAYYQPSGSFSKKQSDEAVTYAEEEKIKEYSKAVHPVILKKYKEAGYILDWLPSANDVNEKNFWLTVDEAKKPVKREIRKLIRLKKGKKEHFFYHEGLTSENKLGAIIQHYHTVGKYEDPTFSPTLNPQTGERFGSEIYSWETVYELEWPKDWSSKLEELVSDKVDMVAIAPTGKHYGGFTLEQFLTYSFDDLVKWGKFGTLSPQAQNEIEQLDIKRKLAKIK